MKKIGILGGMSIHSTLTYMEWMASAIQRRLGGVHSPDLIVDCVDFGVVEKMQAAGAWDELGIILAKRAKGLEKAGAEVIVLATNTMHIVARDIEQSIDVPFLHIADATAQTIKGKNLSTVGLIGTAYTMEKDFYTGRLHEQGISCIVPETHDERKIIQDIIFQQLVVGQILPSSREEFLKAAKKLLERGAEGIILGCTEVNMLMGPNDFKCPVFDTTRIHVDTAIDIAFNE